MATYAVQTWTDEVTWANAADMQHMEAGIALINTQGLPAGGTAGQVLAKSSGTDYAVAWKAVLGSEVVETANIKNLNVTTGKIAVGAVTEEKLTIGAEGKLIPTAGFKTGYILTAGATAAEWKANTGGTGITAAEAEVIASNIAQRENVSARVVLTAKVTLKGIPASAETDGVTLLEGDIVLASKQTGTEAENGLWEVKKGTTAWARPASYATGALKHGIFVPILQGTTHGGSTWVQTNTTFIKVDTEASSWAENSAGTGVIGNPQEFNKEEAKTGVSGATNLDLSKASVFRIELTGAAVFTLTNLPTTYPMEITLLIKQDATGGRTWSFANAAPALEWIGPEPTFETAAGSRAVMQLAVLSKGTEILGWAKAGGSVPAIKAPPPTGMIVGVNWMQDESESTMIGTQATCYTAGVRSERINLRRDSLSKAQAAGFTNNCCTIGDWTSAESNLSPAQMLEAPNKAAWLTKAAAEFLEGAEKGELIFEVINETYEKKGYGTGEGAGTEAEKYEKCAKNNAKLFIALVEELKAKYSGKGWWPNVKFLITTSGRTIAEWLTPTLAELNTAEKKAFVSGWACHPYGGSNTTGKLEGEGGSCKWSRMEQYRTELVAVGFPNTDIWATEWGIECNGPWLTLDKEKAGATALRKVGEEGTCETEFAALILERLERLKVLTAKGSWYYSAHDNTGKAAAITAVKVNKGAWKSETFAIGDAVQSVKINDAEWYVCIKAGSAVEPSKTGWETWWEPITQDRWGLLKPEATATAYIGKRSHDKARTALATVATFK